MQLNTSKNPQPKLWEVALLTTKNGIVLSNALMRRFHQAGLVVYQVQGKHEWLVFRDPSKLGFANHSPVFVGKFHTIDVTQIGHRYRQTRPRFCFESETPSIHKLLNDSARHTQPDSEVAARTQPPTQNQQTTLATPQIPSELQEQLDRFLEAAPEWSLDRVATVSIALFLLQDKRSNTRRTARIYLDSLFKMPVDSFEEVAA